MRALGLLLLFFGLSSGGHRSFLDIYVSDNMERGFFISSEYDSSLAAEDKFSEKAIFDGPLVILVPDLDSYAKGDRRLKLTGYYADKGLRTIAEYANFQPLQQFLLSTPLVSGLAYPGPGFNNEYLLRSSVEKIIVPDGFRTIDVLHGVRQSNIHVLYVAPKDFFNSQGFVSLKKVASFLVDDYTVEPVSSTAKSTSTTEEPMASTTESTSSNTEHPSSTDTKQEVKPTTEYNSPSHQQIDNHYWNYQQGGYNDNYLQAGHHPGFVFHHFGAPTYIFGDQFYRRYRHVLPYH